MKNKLQNYFDVARKEESLVSVEEVRKLTGSGLQSKKQFNLKYKIMIGTGLITLLTLFFYMQNPAEKPVTGKQVNTNEVTTQVTDIKKTQDAKSENKMVPVSTEKIQEPVQQSVVKQTPAIQASPAPTDTLRPKPGMVMKSIPYKPASATMQQHNVVKTSTDKPVKDTLIKTDFPVTKEPVPLRKTIKPSPFSVEEVITQKSRYIYAKPTQYESLGINWDGKDLSYQNWFIKEKKLLSLSVTRKPNGMVHSRVQVMQGSLRPFDNPFLLACISGMDMESPFFFSADSFGMQSTERLQWFRNHVNELLPVVIDQNGEQIVCWFTDHADLRSLLDELKPNTQDALKRPASYEITIQKAEQLGLVRVMDKMVVVPVKSEDVEYSFVAASVTIDDEKNTIQSLGFHSGPVITFSNRYTSKQGDSIAGVFGKITFTPLFVTETNGRFGFVHFLKKLGNARRKELVDAANASPGKNIGDTASFSFSEKELKEFITVKLVADNWALICWYEKDEALAKLLNAQPASEVQHTELYYCAETEKEADIKTYPNPAGRELEVLVTLPQDKVISIDMYDLTGKHCLSMKPEVTNETIGSVHAKTVIEQLKDGIYVVTIRTAKGKCYSRKVIKYGL